MLRHSVPNPTSPRNPAAQGAMLCRQFSCRGRHAASIGPDPGHFASGISIAAWTLPNTPAHPWHVAAPAGTGQRS